MNLLEIVSKGIKHQKFTLNIVIGAMKQCKHKMTSTNFGKELGKMEGFISEKEGYGW